MAAEGREGPPRALRVVASPAKLDALPQRPISVATPRFPNPNESARSRRGLLWLLAGGAIAAITGKTLWEARGDDLKRQKLTFLESHKGKKIVVAYGMAVFGEGNVVRRDPSVKDNPGDTNRIIWLGRPEVFQIENGIVVDGQEPITGHYTGGKWIKFLLPSGETGFVSLDQAKSTNVQMLSGDAILDETGILKLVPERGGKLRNQISIGITPQIVQG